MIVNYAGKIYQVIFIKVPHHAVSKKKKKLLIDTRCTIIVKDKPSDLWSEAKELAVGESKQYIGDKYSKVIGKKYALLDALTVWSDGINTLLLGTAEFRTALWMKFNETFKGWK